MIQQTPPLDSGMDLYDLLQVSSRAHPDVIQTAHRELVRRHDPNVCPNASSATILRQVNAAYAVLGDSERRARYDAYRLRTAPPEKNGAPRPYLAAPAVEREEWVPVAPRSMRKAAGAPD